MRGYVTTVCFILFSLTAPVQAGSPASDQLASWNDGPAKSRIVAFVADVTDPGSKSFVPRPERIAVFDNDGTLWTERPIYNQLAFAIDRVKALSPEHPEWQTEEPFRSILAGDVAQALAGGEQAAVKLLMATHAGMTTAEFEAIVSQWLASARHPRFDRPYTELVYRPMIELLAYLRAHGFKTFIVSGGGIDFMRPWTERVYGIPPEQVVGSRIKIVYDLLEDGPVLKRLAAGDFVDDKSGKPIGINQMIGRRPIAAFGNSDGDLEMLQWTTIGAKAALGMIVHHTDAEREWAYDRESDIGRLDTALDEAPSRGWTVIDMKSDWREIF